MNNRIFYLIILIILIIVLFLFFGNLYSCDNIWPINIEMIKNDSINSLMSINIKKGFWLFSLPLDTDIKIENTGIDMVWGFNPAKQQYYIINDNQKLRSKTGYWIYTDEDIKFNIKGSPIDSYTLRLKKGWCMIGGCTERAQISSDDGNIAHIFILQENMGYVYMRQKDCLIPGQSYWIYFEPFRNKGIVKIYK